MLTLRYILLLLILLPGLLRGQDDSFLFHHFTEEDGLSSNFITCLLKDSRGILWAGTYDGLNWFDGAHFYNFKKTKEKHSLINNVIHDLCEDTDGNIWGGTDNGIFCYDIKQNIFRNYQPVFTKIAPFSAKIARAILNIRCDSKGTVWATGTWTILRFNSSKNSFEELGPLSPTSDSVGQYSVRKNGMIEDPAKTGLWFATVSKGLHFYDYNTGKFTGFKDQAGALFRERAVSSLTISASGTCWFFDNTHQQIVRFDPSTRREIMKIDMAGKVSASLCSVLFEDSQNRLWYGNWNSEIAVVEYKNGVTITSIRNERANHLSIPGNFLRYVSEDKNGTIWLATYGGLSKTNSTKSIYRIHWLDQKIPILKNNSIRVVVENPVDKSWWMATHSPLYAIHYFPLTGRYVTYDLSKAEKNFNDSLPGPVNTIRIIRSKPVLCTWWGAWQIDEVAKRISPFLPGPSVDPSFVIGDLIERDGVFYFSNNNAVCKYESSQDKLYRPKFSTPALPDGQRPAISQLCLTPDNKLWFEAAFGWLARMNDNNTISPFYIVKNDEELSGWINSIATDCNGTIWMAASGAGLYAVNSSSYSVKLWNETDGLVFNHIQNAIADDSGKIWCAAYNRFSVFSPEKGSFYNFTVPLSENTFEYENGLGQLSNGHIVASVENNIVEFFPERLTLKPWLDKPIIGAVNIAGNEKFLNMDTTLQLDPDENSLSLKFGLMTDKETFPYELEYRLNGFDNKWRVAGPDNQAIYNKLPSGNYTFHLKAKAKNGDWESSATTLNIHVLTPFYRSAWFIALVLSVICMLLFSFYRFRLGKQKELYALENKAQLLEKEKALVMYEGLKQQLNPHFLFNSLTSLSSLITVDPKTATQFLDSLSKTYRYILKSRDSETVLLADELKSAENYVKIQQTRFEKGFDFCIKVPEEYLHRKIVPVTLQNMIENAIKHNIIDEESPLVVDVFVQDDSIVVRNNLQRKKYVETSNKQGLANLQSLYRYLTSHPVEIVNDNDFFTIKIPLV